MGTNFAPLLADFANETTLHQIPLDFQVRSYWSAYTAFNNEQNQYPEEIDLTRYVAFDFGLNAKV